MDNERCFHSLFHLHLIALGERSSNSLSHVNELYTYLEYIFTPFESVRRRPCRWSLGLVTLKLPSFPFLRRISVASPPIMSFSAPKVKSKQRSRPTTLIQCTSADGPQPLASGVVIHHHLVSVRDAPRSRHPRNTKGSITYRPGDSGLWSEGSGQIFTQVPISSQLDLPQPLVQQSLSPQQRASPNGPADPPDNFSQFDNTEQPLIYTRRSAEDSELLRQRQRRKREKQSSKWTQIVIPALLDPYLELLRVSDSLRLPRREALSNRHTCPCAKHRKLTITCVFLDSMLSFFFFISRFKFSFGPNTELEELEILYCDCCSAPQQLLSCGLFPCTPTAPSLAVDINMLDFVQQLFLRLAPNNTGWCDTLESLLNSRKYKLQTKVSRELSN